MAAPLAKRLHVRPGQTVLTVNAPPEYARALGDLPDGARLVAGGDPAGADHVHVFVRDSGELARLGPQAVAGARAGAVTWIAYPKRSSGVDTDLTRDRGWEAVTDDIDAVSQVAVDDTWSALRFKPIAEVGRRGERGGRGELGVGLLPAHDDPGAGRQRPTPSPAQGREGRSV